MLLHSNCICKTTNKQKITWEQPICVLKRMSHFVIFVSIRNYLFFHALFATWNIPWPLSSPWHSETAPTLALAMSNQLQACQDPLLFIWIVWCHCCCSCQQCGYYFCCHCSCWHCAPQQLSHDASVWLAHDCLTVWAALPVNCCLYIFFSPSTCNWHYSCLAAMLLVDCHCELFVMSLPLQSPISAAMSSPTCYDAALPL